MIDYATRREKKIDFLPKICLKTEMLHICCTKMDICEDFFRPLMKMNVEMEMASKEIFLLYIGH